MPWRELLTFTGLAFEVVGLTWIVADASRARSEEFGEHGPVRRVANWLRFWLGPPQGAATVKVVGAAVEVSGGGSVTVRTNEPEIERMKRELGELRERQDRFAQETSERFAAAEDHRAAEHRELSERVGGLESRQREVRRATLRGEIRGARLFILGAVLSAVANVV